MFLMNKLCKRIDDIVDDLLFVSFSNATASLPALREQQYLVHFYKCVINIRIHSNKKYTNAHAQPHAHPPTDIETDTYAHKRLQIPNHPHPNPTTQTRTRTLTHTHTHTLTNPYGRTSTKILIHSNRLKHT